AAQQITWTAQRLAPLCVLCCAILVGSEVTAAVLPVPAVLQRDRRPAALVIERSQGGSQHWPVHVFIDRERVGPDALGRIEQIATAGGASVAEIRMPAPISAQLADLTAIPGPELPDVSHRFVGLASHFECGTGTVARARVLPLDGFCEDRHLLGLGQ